MTYNDLLEDWIIYLKNNRLVRQKPNPDGTLDYIRGPDSTDIQKFLTSKGYKREDIHQAMQDAGEPAGTLPAYDEQPANNQQPQHSNIIEPEPPAPKEEPPEPAKIEIGQEMQFPGLDNEKYKWNGKQWLKINPSTGKPSKFATKEVSKVLSQIALGKEPETRDILSARKKIGLMSSREYVDALLVEAIKLKSYSEDQIKKIFKTITSISPDIALVPKDEPPRELELVPQMDLEPKEIDTPEYQAKLRQQQEKKTNELNAIKKSIRDKFTDSQRKALWRILSNA